MSFLSKFRHHSRYPRVSKFLLTLISNDITIQGERMSFKLTTGSLYALALAVFLDAASQPTVAVGTPTYTVTGDAVSLTPSVDGMSAQVVAAKEGSASLVVTVDGVSQSYSITVADAPKPLPNPVASFTVTLTDSLGVAVPNA